MHVSWNDPEIEFEKNIVPLDINAILFIVDLTINVDKLTIKVLFKSIEGYTVTRHNLPIFIG